jgi:hypothetical protein
MSIQQKDPGLARQTCLGALEIAILHSNTLENKPYKFSYDDVQALKLSCKRLKQAADELITYLLIEGINTDYEVILKRPALLKNLRLMEICAETDEDTFGLTSHPEEIHRVLQLTAHNLHTFSAYRVPALLGILKGTSWPNLQFLCLETSRGHIAQLKEEFFSMLQLRSLSLVYQKLQKADCKIIAAAPFLPKLEDLDLNLSGGDVTTAEMSRILTKATNLRKLGLYGDLNFDYFGSAKLEALEILEYNNEFENGITVHLDPLLSQTRPNLRTVIVKGGFVSNEELENLLTLGKDAMPNLKTLELIALDDDFDDEGDVKTIDWSCLRKADFPNLIELTIKCPFKDIVGLAQPTAKLPKLRHLDVKCNGTSWPPRNYALETSEYTEKLFSTPFLQQLTCLGIRSSYFRLDSLVIFC